MELWVGALNLGFLYAFMTMGVYFTFRIHDFPDITVDGSFTTGAAISAVLIVSGVNPFLALGAAFLIGMAAGTITAFIHTRLNINGLLAGILVMTGLYSINLHIMGRSNIPLLNQVTFLSYLERVNPGLPGELFILIALSIVIILFWFIVSSFLKTDLGIAMRATGNNPIMSAATGVNVNRMKIFGVALANGLVGISGGLVAQYQGFADIGMGIGTIVIGLAAVIIGESLFKTRSISLRVCSVILGSVIFRFMIAFALYVGMNPLDLKLLTAFFVLIALIIPKILSGRKTGPLESLRKINQVFSRRGFQYGLICALVITAAVLFGYQRFQSTLSRSSKVYRIGVVQLTDNGLLNITRDSFMKEMEGIGYRNGENCVMMLENANGDLPTVNSILDKLLQEKVDVVVTISTGCTQVALNKIKSLPVVFATVANPFIIGAGTSETEHLPNVTGVYGWAPMDRTMEIVRQILPGKLTIGAIWDPAQTNSVFNVTNLKKAIESYDDVTFQGASITNSSEVYEAATSLVQRGINAFVLCPDNIVYSAFESVVKAARKKNIPIFISDVERLEDGALVALGYDYTISGIQAAHLVDRILKGENPRGIPFERYSKLTFGINLDVAQSTGTAIPPDLMTKATILYRAGDAHATVKSRIGIIQFAMEPNVELCKEGILKALADNGYEDKKNLELIYKNAQADFSMINSIIQDFIRRKVDIIVPLSTPCVQSAVQFARDRQETKVVFTYIYDPYKIGAAKTPVDHLPNMTGISCFPPIEQILDLIREMFPEKKKVGIVWNSSEANSEAVLVKVRAHASKTGLKIIEATAASPAEVLEASRSLVARGAQVFLNGGDNTLNVSFSSFAKVADENRIPVFSVDSELIEQGACVAFGPDYYQTGYDCGRYLAQVLQGKDPKYLPIHQTKATLLYLNMDTAKRNGLHIAETIVKRANKVIDSSKRTSTQVQEKGKKLALFLFSDHNTIRESAKGVMEELEQSGTLSRHHITVDTKNAQNEFYMAQSIAQDIVSQRYDYIITLTTPVLQATANTNKKIPHVFGAVTDPYRVGVAKNSREHIANITGVATVEPVEATIKAMRELFPKAKRIGIIWNPSEACSETCTYKARSAAKTYQFELIEATVSTTAEITNALKSLINRKVDLFLTSGDNTVIMALESIAGTLRQHKIPYFTNSSSDVEHGTFVSIGPDYIEIGRETARMAERVINGEDPRTIPIENYAPDMIYVNLSLAQEYGIPIPLSFLKKAARVWSGGKIVKPPEAAPAPAESTPSKKLALFLFSDNYLLRECAKGVTDELERSGTLRSHNITVDMKNAQNEFTMAQSIAQDIVWQKYDYIITISTPALQVMANTNKKIPHVFGAVTDPYRMGVAKNSRDHLPNVTGVATFQPVATTIKVMRELFPKAKRIGIVWNPSEACSEACTYKAREAVKKYNFELLEVTVTGTGEVLDAAQTVISKKADLFLTSGDNTVIMALPSVAELLKRHRLPYFTNTPMDIELGAMVSIGADYIEVGKATAQIAERVINGENPKNILINNYVPEKMYVNQALAKEYGIDLPAAFLKRAARVKR